MELSSILKPKTTDEIINSIKRVNDEVIRFASTYELIISKRDDMDPIKLLNLLKKDYNKLLDFTYVKKPISSSHSFFGIINVTSYRYDIYAWSKRNGSHVLIQIVVKDKKVIFHKFV